MKWLDEDQYLGTKKEKDDMDVDTESPKGYAYFISRGTELCDVSEGVCEYFHFLCYLLFEMIFPNSIYI